MVELFIPEFTVKLVGIINGYEPMTLDKPEYSLLAALNMKMLQSASRRPS